MKPLQKAFRILSSHWIFEGREAIQHFNWHSLTLGLSGHAGHCWEMYWSANIFAGTIFFPTCLKHFVTALEFFLCCQRLPSIPLTHKKMVFHQCKARILECALDKVNEDACKWDFSPPVLLFLTSCIHAFSVYCLMLCSNNKYFSLSPLNLVWFLVV